MVAGSSPAILAGNRARWLEMPGVDVLGPASGAAPWRRRGDPGGGAARGEAGHGGATRAAACSQGRCEVDAGGVQGRRGVCGSARRGAAFHHVFPGPFAGDEHSPGLYMEHLLDPE
ncbi:unnamed protein product [Urochloa humidicola]